MEFYSRKSASQKPSLSPFCTWRQLQDTENYSVHFNFIFSNITVYQRVTVLISYTARPWVKKGMFSSFFPTLNFPVSRYDVESDVSHVKILLTRFWKSDSTGHQHNKSTSRQFYRHYLLALYSQNRTILRWLIPKPHSGFEKEIAFSGSNIP